MVKLGSEGERIQRWLAPHAGPALSGLEPAEELFLRGRLKEAARALERAQGPLVCLKAIVMFLRGERERALEFLKGALLDEDALAWGLAGFLAMRLKREEYAWEAIGRAVRLRPQAGWPLALRVLIRRLASGPGHAAAALADLDLALKREPSAWIHQLRAEYREKGGHMAGALADLDQAIALSAPSAILHAQRGHCLFYMKRYGEAVADFSRALALLPGHAPFLWQRANAQWLAGDLEAACEDARRAAKAEPACAAFRLGAARFAVLLGREETVAADLRRWQGAADPTLRSGALFLAASMRFRAKDYDASLPDFEEAERIAYSERSPAVFTKVGYTHLTRAFRFMSRSAKESPMEDPIRKPVLIIAGLGLHYPYQATLEVLKALSECDVVFNNLSGAEAMEFLTLFCRDVRTVSYDGLDEEAWAEEIFSALGPGRRAAFVTRGHPFVAGHLAQHLLARARKEGVEVRSYGAVSYLDDILALAGLATVESFWGIQVYDTRLAVEGSVQLQPNLLLILEAAGGRGAGLPAWVDRHIGELVRKLRTVYPPGHRFYIYGPRYEARQLEEASLVELEERLRGLDPELFSSVAILAPPVENQVPLELQAAEAYA